MATQQVRSGQILDGSLVDVDIAAGAAIAWSKINKAGASLGDLGGTLPVAAMPAFTGDVTSPAGATVNTLATVNPNVGTFGNAGATVAITVNAKGLITAAAQQAITITAAAMPAYTGDVTSPAGSTVNTLATVNATVGTFGSATKTITLTVNAKGLVTAVSEQLLSGGGGGLTGTGTAGKLTKWTGASVLADSLLSESGTAVTLAGSLVVTGPGTTAAIRIGAWASGGNYSMLTLNGNTALGANFYSNDTAPLFINRQSGTSINFRENNLDQMVLLSGGNLGIGVITPGTATRLQVAGKGLFTGGTPDAGDGTPAGCHIGWDGTYGFIAAIQTSISWRPLELRASAISTTAAMTVAVSVASGEFYASGWFRNSTAAQGLYNSAYGIHFAAVSTLYWGIGGAASAGGLQFLTQGLGTAKGYIHWDASGFGLLTSAGAWGIRLDASTNYIHTAYHFVQDVNCWVFPGSVSGMSAGQASYYLASHASYGLYINTGLYVAGQVYAGPITQAASQAVYPGSATGANFQMSYYLQSHSSYGLYTNTGMYFAGTVYIPGTLCAARVQDINYSGSTAIAFDSSCRIVFNSANTANQGMFDGTQFYPSPSASMHLGHPAFRWVNIFMQGGIDNSSDARLKRDIAPTAYGAAFLAALRPVDYRWTNAPLLPGRYSGFLAQEVAAVAPGFGGLSFDDDGIASGLNYTQFIAPLVAGWQDHEARLAALEQKGPHAE